MKHTIIIALIGLFIFSSCSEWKETETIDSKINRPWDQNPVLWAKYTDALRSYKQSEHFITYAHLYNSPASASSEQDFMRCLPDSLDYVSLTNGDNFSKYDAEDMAVMRQKGTRILYHVDYAARMTELSDATKLGAYLDRVIASVNANGLDGYSFSGLLHQGNQANEDASKLIVAKLSKDDSKVLVFEGNPLFIVEADRTKIDLFVLDTKLSSSVSDVKFTVLDAINSAKIPTSKLLLAAKAESLIMNGQRVEVDAIEELSHLVITLGPLGGLATYDISKDYYHSDKNYKTIRTAIQTLNPSK